jgi:NADPH-dependent curcumin reductase
VFFDNVGDVVLNEVLARINLKARIVLCGAISRYNETVLPPGPSNYFPEAIEALARWQREGKLVQKEDVAFGLENAPRTLMRLFTGENFGKQLLKIADAPLS